MKTRAAVLREIGCPGPYAQTRPLQIEALDLAPPGPGEVLVKLRAAGLCHSDLSVINGDRPRPVPMVLGHEASADVVDVGPNVTDLRPGDRVVLIFVPSCGHCVSCAEGRPALCEPAAAANTRGSLLSGQRRLRHGDTEIAHLLGVSAFSEHAVVARNSCIKLTGACAELSPVEAALFGCAVLTGVGAVVNTARVQPGTSVAVLGLGGVGLCAVLGALAAGARQVVAIDLHDSKLRVARDLGASATINASDPQAIEQLKSLTSGGVDTAFEMAGSVQAMETAYRMTRRGGLTVTAGLPHPDRKWPLQHLNLVAEERTVKGSYLGSCVPLRDIPRYIALYQAGRLPVNKLMGQQIALDNINEGFDRLATGEDLRDVIVF